MKYVKILQKEVTKTLLEAFWKSRLPQTSPLVQRIVEELLKGPLKINPQTLQQGCFDWLQMQQGFSLGGELHVVKALLESIGAEQSTANNIEDLHEEFCQTLFEECAAHDANHICKLILITNHWLTLQNTTEWNNTFYRGD